VSQSNLASKPPQLNKGCISSYLPQDTRQYVHFRSFVSMGDVFWNDLEKLLVTCIIVGTVPLLRSYCAHSLFNILLYCEQFETVENTCSTCCKLKNYSFCSHSVPMCIMWSSRILMTISINISRLVVTLNTEFGLCAVETKFLIYM
jgi:hypothetical protein